MNKRNLIMGLAASALIATTSIGAVACTKAPALVLKLDGATTGSTKAGDGYEVKFSLKGFDDFTYAITGENAASASFDKDTKMFSADKAGTYVLTISATKGTTKKEFSVTITVTAAGNSAALKAEIAKTEAFVESDYTPGSWTALKTALKDATDIADEATASQEDLDAAKDALSEAIADLTAKALTKATVSAQETEFSFKGVTYNEAAYYNFAEVLTKVKTLNAKTDIKLNSVYAAEFAKLVGELDARIKMTVSGLYDAKGGVVTTANKDVSFSVAADQGAEVKVYNVGESENTEIVPVQGVYNLATAWDTAYKVRVVAQKAGVEESKVTKDYEFKLHALDLGVRDGENGGGSDMTKLIKVENNQITTMGETPFEGTNFNGQAFINSMDLEGEFTARMTVTYNGKWAENNNNVVWMGISKTNLGTDIDWNGYGCARYGAAGSTEELEVGVRGVDGNQRADMDNAISMAVGSRITYEYSRKATKDADGKVTAWTYSFAAINPATGAYAGSATRSVAKEVDVAGANRVRIAFGFENIKATISDISVISESIVDKGPLGALIKNAKSGQYIEQDYTEESWILLQTKIESAWSAMNNFTLGSTFINAAATDLEAAIEGLTSKNLADVIAVVNTEAGSWTYNEAIYDANGYQDVKLDEIEALNARTATDYEGADAITLYSQYDAEIQKIIATLVKAVEFDVTGLATQTYAGAAFAPIEFTVSSTEAESIVVKDNGTILSGSEGAYTLAYTETGSHVIEITATKGDKVSRREYTVEFYKTAFTANHDGVTVSGDNKITMGDANANWDSGYNLAIKACDKNVVFTGDFRVQFDATALTKSNDTFVIAFQMFNAAGWTNEHKGEFAIRYRDNKVAACNGNGADLAAGTLALNKKTTFVVERKGTDALFYVLGENGEKLGLATSPAVYQGAVVLGWNFENITATVENIQVTAATGTVVDKTALRTLYDEAQKLQQDDYATGWTTFAVAQIQANAVLNKFGDKPANMVTQKNVDDALEALRSAKEALVKVAFDLVEVSETEFTYDGVTYKSTEWFTWGDVKAQIESLNAIAGDLTASGYYKSVEAHIATLAMQVTIAGLENNYYFSNFAKSKVEFRVSAPDVAAVEVTANGTAVAAVDGIYAYQPTSSGKVEFIVTAVGADGETVVTQTREAEINIGDVEVFRDDDTLNNFITIKDDGLQVVQGTGWSGHNERKAYVGNVQVAGNFAYSADFTFNQKLGDGGNVATLHTGFSTNDRSPRRGVYLAICYQNTNGKGALEIGDWGSKVNFDIAAEDLACIQAGGTIRATLQREIRPDKYVYTAIFANAETGKEIGRRVWGDISDAGRRAQLEISQLSFNFENCGVTVGNIAITGDVVIDRSALKAAMTAAKAVQNPSDELKTVLEAAVNAYGGDAIAGGVDKGDIRTKAELDALTARLNALVEAQSFMNVAYSSKDGTTTVAWTKQEGVAVTVKLDGAEQTLEGDSFAYKPVGTAVHTIEVIAAKDDQTITRTITARNVTQFTVNDGVKSKIEVQSGGKIVSKEFAGWDEGTNCKVKSTVKMSGDFRVEFDATVTDQTGDPRVIVLQLGNGDQRGEFAIRYHNGRLAVKQEPGAEVAALKNSKDVKYHFVAERIDRLGIFYIIDAEGNVVGKSSWSDMIEGDREIAFTFENIKAVVENVQAFTLR